MRFVTILIAGLALGTPAAATTYSFSGEIPVHLDLYSSHEYDTLFVTYDLEIAPEDFGTDVNPSGTARFYLDGTLVETQGTFFGIAGYFDYPDEPYCIDDCSYASTDATGNLLSHSASSTNGYDDEWLSVGFNAADKTLRIHFETADSSIAYRWDATGVIGNMTVDPPLVPLPAPGALLALGLAGISLLRRRGTSPIRPLRHP